MDYGALQGILVLHDTVGAYGEAAVSTPPDKEAVTVENSGVTRRSTMRSLGGIPISFLNCYCPDYGHVIAHAASRSDAAYLICITDVHSHYVHSVDKTVGLLSPCCHHAVVSIYETPLNKRIGLQSWDWS